jgi:tRNA uridine 5-carbamoylmethylation protein Kti12
VTSVLILTGPPGAGKTTTARTLAARFERAVHLEADLFFDFIRSGFVEPWKPESHEQNATVMRIVAAAAAGYAEAGYFTIVDGIVIPRWFLAPLSDALREAGQLVAYAVLRAPLEVCAVRVRERDSQALADPAVVERVWNEFAELGRWAPHAIEIGARRPEEVAALLAERLSAGSLALR